MAKSDTLIVFKYSYNGHWYINAVLDKAKLNYYKCSCDNLTVIHSTNYKHQDPIHLKLTFIESFSTGSTCMYAFKDDEDIRYNMYASDFAKLIPSINKGVVEGLFRFKVSYRGVSLIKY